MPSPAETPDTSTRLAIERTFLAHERTMMAWVRTAASMISFGFTIYKFFQLEHAGRAPTTPHLVGPREFAVILIGIGLGALALAAIENRRSMQMLRGTFQAAVPGSIAGLVAALVAGLGVIAILVVIFRQ